MTGTPKKSAGKHIKAAGDRGQSGASDACPHCTKVGLAILPVTATPALRSLFNRFADVPADVKWLNALQGKLDSPDRVLSWDFLRALPPGYLYVLKPNKTWDAYLVGGDGLLKKTPVALLEQSPESVTLSKNCSREGHSNLKPQFFCIDPKLHPHVWVAYSRHQWTPAVRKRYEDNAEGCRKRMTQIDLASAASGSVGLGTTVPQATLATKDALLCIADYTATAFKNRLQAELLYPIYDRAGQAESLAQAMASASANTPARRGLVLYLEDPVGVAEELGHLRMQAVLGHQEWIAGGPDVAGAGKDPERPWKRQSATHVAYLEAWAESMESEQQRQNWTGHKEQVQKMNREGFPLGVMTRETFERDYRPLTVRPLHQGRGLNAYYKAEWIPLQDSQGRPAPSGMGYIKHHDDWYEALGQYHAEIRYGKRAKRMHERLRFAELQSFNVQYELQEKAWGEHIAALDNDYVAFLEQVPLGRVLQLDFENDKKWADAKVDAQAVAAHMRDALARLQATERALGGAAVSEHSIAFLKKQIEKTADDESNWIHKALISDLGFKAVVADEWKAAGTAPDLYEIALGGANQVSKESRDRWVELWQAYRDAGHQSAQNLVLPIQQVINHLRARALAESGGQLARAASVLDELARKEVVWVRAAALQEYLGTVKRHYSIKVKWGVGEFLDAHSTAFDRPAFSLEPRLQGDRSVVRNHMHRARNELQRLARDPRFAGQILTVPLIVESEVLIGRASRAGEATVQVFSDDLLGAQRLPSTLPRSVVEALIQRRPAGRLSAFNAVKSREGVFTAFALFLSARELWVALGNMTKSGFEQADAVASLASAITGIMGGAAEVGAMVTQAAATGGTQATGAVTTMAFSRALLWRLGAGILGATGAWADASSSFIKASRAHDQGNFKASSHYRISGRLLIGSGASSLGGALVTWRSALAARAGAQTVQLLSRQAAVGLLRGAALRTSAGALMGASLTGVGLVLFAAGIIWALYAQSLEDDDNEMFLRRSYWGTRDEGSQPFGGSKVSAATAVEEWHAKGIDAEMMALGNLALGYKGEITDWNGNWFADDVVEFSFKLGAWDAKTTRFEYFLYGYADKARKGPATLLRRGPLPHEIPALEDQIYAVSVEHWIDDDKFKAVKLDFAIYRNDELAGRDSLWATVDD